MKKLFILFITFPFLLSSCGGDEKDEPNPDKPEIQNPMEVSLSNVVLDALTGKIDITIKNAPKTISATSENTNIAVCEIIDSHLHIEAFLVGNTIVSVKSGTQEAKVNVEVKGTLNYLGNPVLKFGLSQENVKKLTSGTIDNETTGKMREHKQISQNGITLSVYHEYQFVQDKLKIVTSTIVSSNVKTAGILMALGERYLPSTQNPPHYYTYKLSPIVASLQAFESNNSYTITYTSE